MASSTVDASPASELNLSDVRLTDAATDATLDAPAIDTPRPDVSTIDVAQDTASPDVPATPDTPDVLDAPPMPDVPLVPDIPDVPDVTDVPDDAPPAMFRASYPLSARFTEGGTYDPTSHRFFVGSLGDGSVHSIGGNTATDEVFYRETAPGRWWTLGMDVDVTRRRLAVCSMEDRRALGDSSHPYDGYILVFDLDSGARVARVPLAPAFATATCTDVAFSADGGMYVCDREHPRIYRIAPGGALSTFVTNDLLAGGAVGQNALVMLPDQSALLSLIYLPSRLVRIGITDRRVTDVSLRGTFFDGLPLLSGADGMTLSGTALLVAFTSQVTRVTPTLADWSAASTATLDVPAGMTDIVHTPGGDYLLNGQSVTFAHGTTPNPFQLMRFVGTF